MYVHACMRDRIGEKHKKKIKPPSYPTLFPIPINKPNEKRKIK